MADLAREVEVACAVARRAGEKALGYFRRGVAVETKADLSPVTDADRECERLIAASLSEAFPGDGLMGEEGADKPAAAGRRWIIDPIDGTREFIRGNPAWAVLLGLEDAGEVVAGVAHFPAMRETFYAWRGGGAYLDGRPIRVSSVGDVSEAVACVNSFNVIGRFPFAPRLLEWLRPFWAVRSMGGCVDAVMVARGQADLWIECTGKPWDFAPLQVLAEEAGAAFFDFAGRRTIYGGNCIICTPALAGAARDLLAMH